MNDNEIFNHLFNIATLSDDMNGVVTACLVRGNQIIAEGYSNNQGIHAEYAVILEIRRKNIKIEDGDILYTTVIPCGKRTPGGQGEKYGDCTTNIINSGIKNIVYGADDVDASSDVEKRLGEAKITIRKVEFAEVCEQSKSIFNSTVTNTSDLI